MKTVVTVHSFSKLRNICDAQIDFTKKACPWARDVSLRTSFNNELELLDLDWDEFMWPWADEFGIPIHGQFNYYDYFWEIEFLPWFWLKSVFGYFKTGANFHWKPARPLRPDLTVGDFAASVIVGRFVKRNNLCVNLLSKQ